MAKTSSNYTSVRDRFDGGGKGKSGPTFSGGPLSKAANAVGIKPLAARAVAPSGGGGGGGADSGRAAARVEAQRAAGLAARNYKGNSDSSSGDGQSPLTNTANATAAPVKVMKRTYMGAPPKGYDSGKQGEYTYFKSEMVDAPAKPMKKGGKVRGCGCATRGTKGGKMV